MPFPYLGDQVTQKRMKLNEGWYPFVTDDDKKKSGYFIRMILSALYTN